MVVSYWGTPKWIVCNGNFYENGWFGGTPILRNLHKLPKLFQNCYFEWTMMTQWYTIVRWSTRYKVSFGSSCYLDIPHDWGPILAAYHPVINHTWQWRPHTPFVRWLSHEKPLQLYRRVPSHAWSVPLPLSQVLPGSGNISFCTQLIQDGIGTGDRWWSSASGEKQVQPEMRQWCCTWVNDGKWLNDQ